MYTDYFQTKNNKHTFWKLWFGKKKFSTTDLIQLENFELLLSFDYIVSCM